MADITPALIQTWREHAAAGNPDAMYLLGVAYDQGDVVEQSAEQAFAWYEKAADLGQVNATYNLAECYANGYGVAQDNEKAFECYDKAAFVGDADALFKLGGCFREGKGTAQNLEKAFKCYEQAAQAGHQFAMHSLAVCYISGHGVEQNNTFAFEYFKKTAETGLSDAMLHLAQCYASGRGTEQNYTLAFEWYKKAANAGVLQAIVNLGVCYLEGLGTAKNYVLAAEWLAKAADAGDPKAMFNLAVCYLNALGAIRNKVLAFEWFTKAADAGNIRAMLVLLLISSKSQQKHWKVKYLETVYPAHQDFHSALSELTTKASKAIKLDICKKQFDALMCVILDLELEHLYKADTNDQENHGLTHYTSQVVLDTMLGGRHNNIEQQKSKHTTKLRLYMTAYLNDPTEGKFAFDVVRDDERFNNLDMVEQRFTHFYHDAETLTRDLPAQMYSLSFSKSADNLNLWRAYGLGEGKANGVGLFIPDATLSPYLADGSKGLATVRAASEVEEEFLLYEVRYGAAEVAKLWKTLLPPLIRVFKTLKPLASVDKVMYERLNDIVVLAMSRLIYLYKHDAYAAEQEVRAIRIVPLKEAQLDARAPARLFVETPELLFKDAGSAIVLGPKMSADERAVLLWETRKRLEGLGLDGIVKVRSSTVPYR